MIEVGPAEAAEYGWIAQRAQLVIGPAFRAVKATKDGQIVAMVGYDSWTPNSCSMHVAIDNPIAVRRLIKLAFEIPFVKCDRGVVLGSVLEGNRKALDFDLNLGFRQIAFIRDAWAKGVGIHILEMRREECRWLR